MFNILNATKLSKQRSHSFLTKNKKHRRVIRVSRHKAFSLQKLSFTLPAKVIKVRGKSAAGDA